MSDEYDDDDPCDHDDYDCDVLSGRCYCWHCGEGWYATADQIDAQLKFEADYYEIMEREERRQWWRDLFAPIRRPVRRLIERIQIWRDSRNFQHSIGDDDIPF